jgi:hypothetical protein
LSARLLRRLWRWWGVQQMHDGGCLVSSSEREPAPAAGERHAIHVLRVVP